jgi:hypothetical protein
MQPRCCSVTSAAATITIAASLPFYALAGMRGSETANAIQIVSQVQEAENKREADVNTIVCTRRYVLKNKRWDKDAVMHVRTTWQSGSGKRFEIVKMENAEGLQKRVFNKLLEGEAEASRQEANMAESAIVPANYDFLPLGTETLKGRQCLVLQLIPKRSSKYLIEGKAWVDPKEHAIIRIEGRTAKSVSFWIGKPYIVQEFQKVGDVWVSSINRSISDVKLIGKTELAVDFSNYDIGRGRKLAQNAGDSKKLLE